MAKKRGPRYRCGATTEDGTPCRQLVAAPGGRCYQHPRWSTPSTGSGGRFRARSRSTGAASRATVNAAPSRSKTSPPAPSAPQPSPDRSSARSSTATVRRLRQERVAKVAEFCADVIGDGWEDAIAGQATNYLTEATRRALLRGPHSRNCKALAALARAILAGKQQVHSFVGSGISALTAMIGGGPVAQAGAGCAVPVGRPPRAAAGSGGSGRTVMTMSRATTPSTSTAATAATVRRSSRRKDRCCRRAIEVNGIPTTRRDLGTVRRRGAPASRWRRQRASTMGAGGRLRVRPRRRSAWSYPSGCLGEGPLARGPPDGERQGPRDPASIALAPDQQPATHLIRWSYKVGLPGATWYQRIPTPRRNTYLCYRVRTRLSIGHRNACCPLYRSCGLAPTSGCVNV
jgi:hypothetical protein